MIESLSLDAPGGLGGEFKGASLQMGSATQRRAEPVPTRMRVLAEHGDLLRELPVNFTEQRSGQGWHDVRL